MKKTAPEEGRVQIVAGARALEARLVDARTLSALSEERLAILRALAETPRYPAELSRELGMPAQALYYHVRLLREAGLVAFERYQEAGGALAKKYRSTAEALALPLTDHWKPFSAGKSAFPSKYFEPFIRAHAFRGRIVVGSPDPHGKFRARGSELCAMELAMLLGSHASFEYPLYYLDTEMDQARKKEPLIVIGGPKVNMVLAAMNPHLPLRFDERTLELRSTLTGRKYAENFGCVQLVDNPFNRAEKALVLAGSDHTSTRTAVMALLKERKRMEEGNAGDPSVLAKVVQGFDEDGDGIVDAVEMLE